MHLEQVPGVVGNDLDPVANHTVASSPVPLEVRGVRGRVHVLEPLGDTEPDRVLRVVSMRHRRREPAHHPNKGPSMA